MQRHTNLTVAKFGGSSLADAQQFSKVAEIVRSNPARRFIVPSAPGKRASGDTKVTDLLLGAVKAAADGGDPEPLLAAVAERFDSIIAGLGLSLELSAEYAALRAAVDDPAQRDFAVSRGEAFNAMVLSALLGFPFVDAAEVVFFDKNGVFDPKTTYEKLPARLEGLTHAVIPGFYGSLPDGRVKTFSRGGSDISGSVVARGVHADLYENWTDVPGFLMADPRIVENPKTIRTITYKELRELAYMGATVLHEDAVFPVRDAGIPINIRNTNDPAAAGTVIVAGTDFMDLDNVITGVAGRRGFCFILIEKEMMNVEVGFGRRVLSVLEQYDINFEHMPSGIDSLCVIVPEKEIAGKEKEVLDGIMVAASPDVIRLERNVALIAVVGRAMKSSIGTAAKLFRCIAAEGINIRMIDQGSSELNIILGVDENKFDDAVCAIYHAFVK